MSKLKKVKAFIKYNIISLKIKIDSSIFLAIFAALAFVLANTEFADTYFALWHTVFSIKIYGLELSYSLHFLINEVFMTLFFLLVGIEIKSEIKSGLLSSFKQSLLPVLAAVGGVVMPALIYLFLNNDPLLLKGWAIPTATDIAFAISVLNILKRFIPNNLKIFLLTLAIIDDVIAIIIISIFYSAGINLIGLLIAIIGISLISVFNHIKVNYVYFYLIIGGIAIWSGLFIANIHPTLAGVIVGLMIPIEKDNKRGSFFKNISTIVVKINYKYKFIKSIKKAYATGSNIQDRVVPIASKIQQILHPLVSYIIMPSFALANAGISIKGVNFYESNTVLLITSIVTALVIGKPLGIILVSIIAVRTKLCVLPQNIKWRHIILVGFLAGIGFTMSIFIAMLGFEFNKNLLDASKFAVLIGSLIASILGLIWGMICSKIR